MKWAEKTRPGCEATAFCYINSTGTAEFVQTETAFLSEVTCAQGELVHQEKFWGLVGVGHLDQMNPANAVHVPVIFW